MIGKDGEQISATQAHYHDDQLIISLWNKYNNHQNYHKANCYLILIHRLHLAKKCLKF